MAILIAHSSVVQFL